MYSWVTYDASALKVLEESKIISFSWKELHEDKTHVKCIADYDDYVPGKVNDKSLCKDIWEVLDKADICIGHNLASFDLKKINARFVINGLDAPSDYEIVDTLKVAKSNFRFDSNNLNALGGYLKEGHKISNGGFDLWVRCMAGDAKAWKLMKEYNIQDVLLLERIYLRLRPYMSNHPNVNLLVGGIGGSTSCDVCQSTDMSKRGFHYTRTGRKQRYNCNSCGSWSSGSFERVRSSMVEEEPEDDHGH